MPSLLERAVPAGWTRSPLGILTPPPARRRYELPVAVDLFAGAGGMGCGFHQAGFHVAAASEVWEDAAMTYMVNLARPGVRCHFDSDEREASFAAAVERQYKLDEKSLRKHPGIVLAGGAGSGWIAKQPASHPGCEQFFVYDIRNLTGELILDALGLDVGEVACVTGGPPCQGFSAAGRRNVMDPRNSLVFEFARLITEIQPHTFVMENVPGLASMVTPEGLPVLDAFALALEDGEYGEYDALRRSLAGRPEAGAGVRKPKKVDKSKARKRSPAKKHPEPGPDGALW